MIASKPPKNYLNNKDILREIHKSKITYSSYSDPKYQDYDAIVSLPLEESVSPETLIPLMLDPEVLDLAATKYKQRNGLSSDSVVATSDLVFRVMTYDHIPQVFKPVSPTDSKSSKKRSGKKTVKASNKLSFEQLFSSDLEIEMVDELIESMNVDVVSEQLEEYVGYEKVNFAPYQHIKFTDDSLSSFVVVGKSHWSGDVITGKFCPDKGQMTRELANMLLLLCKRIGTKFNWRGYTYIEDMQGSAVVKLVQVALKFNEATSANPFAFFTTIINHEFTKILNEEKGVQSLRDDLMEINGLNPSWTRQMSAATPAVGISQHE